LIGFLLNFQGKRKNLKKGAYIGEKVKEKICLEYEEK